MLFSPLFCILSLIFGCQLRHFMHNLHQLHHAFLQLTYTMPRDCPLAYPQKMLSQTLKRLEQIGLVARHVYPEVPPRVEYSITELGKSLMPHVIGLMEWATQNFENIVRNEGDL